MRNLFGLLALATLLPMSGYAGSLLGHKQRSDPAQDQ